MALSAEMSLRRASTTKTDITTSVTIVFTLIRFAIFFIIGALIVVVILIVVKIFSGISTINKVKNEAENAQVSIIERFFGIFDKAFDLVEQNMDSMNETGDMFNQTTESHNEAKNKITMAQFNGPLEIYSGTNMGTGVEAVLDSVITNNKKQDRKITVKYVETETQDEDQIKKIKQSIGTYSEYEVSFEYDEEGYMNKVTIEKVISEFEIHKFNNSLEMYSGSEKGMSVISLIDNIITSNKTEDRKITVEFMNTETQNEEEIKAIKRNFGTFDNCEVTFEYDTDGFIIKAIIEKL